MERESLNILWTNADPAVSHNMVMMYAMNSIKKGWWDEVTVIIWGATAPYVAKDVEIRKKIKMAKECGVKFSACLSCATEYGVVNDLTSQGIEVKYWGAPLTELIKSDAKIITI